MKLFDRNVIKLLAIVLVLGFLMFWAVLSWTPSLSPPPKPPDEKALTAMASRIGKALNDYKSRNGQYPISLDEWLMDEPTLDRKDLEEWTYRVSHVGDIVVSRGDYMDDGWIVWWSSEGGVGLDSLHR